MQPAIFGNTPYYTSVRRGYTGYADGSFDAGWGGYGLEPTAWKRDRESGRGAVCL